MRTRYNIIWSCVSTFFICTWVAIHPNIPPRNEGQIRALWTRIKLMLWMLIVPELLLAWAYKQWSAAWYIAEYFKDEGWTPIHAHFLIMGGFVYVEGEHESVLDFYKFRELLGLRFRDHSGKLCNARPPQIAFPTITAAEICDKARDDFLSKAIAVLQSLWFALQCIERAKQGLALTELELVTVALASLNGVVCFFWWDKPLGVKEPVKLYRDGHEPPKKLMGEEGSKQDRREQGIEDPSKCSLVRRLICPIQYLLKDSCTTFTSCCASICRQVSSISASDIKQFLKDQRNQLHEDIPGVNYFWFLYLPIYWFTWIPVKDIAIAFAATGGTEHFDSRSYVPTFYALAPPLDSRPLILLVLPLVAITFGALHCAGWNFHFPSHVEQLLWRIGSLAITLLPTIPLLVLTLAYLKDVLEKLSFVWISDATRLLIPYATKDIIYGIGLFFAGASLVAYMVARLVLLTLAVELLRKQPESAFYAINWANFLPHI